MCLLLLLNRIVKVASYILFDIFHLILGNWVANFIFKTFGLLVRNKSYGLQLLRSSSNKVTSARSRIRLHASTHTHWLLLLKLVLVVEVGQDLAELSLHLAYLAIVILVLLLMLIICFELFSFIALLSCTLLSIILHLVIWKVAIISLYGWIVFVCADFLWTMEDLVSRLVSQHHVGASICILLNFRQVTVYFLFLLLLVLHFLLLKNLLNNFWAQSTDFWVALHVFRL